jgi:hypothetical protein
MDAEIGSGTLRATQLVDTGGTPVKVWIAPIVVAALIAACGGVPGTGSTDPDGASGNAGAAEASDPAAAFVGTYTGEMVLSYGGFTYSTPVSIAVESQGPGVLRVPVRELCPSVDHVDIAPPDTLVIALAEPGAWSFQLPRGEKVRLGSIHIRFEPDGKTLAVALRGAVEGHDLEWSFAGAR